MSNIATFRAPIRFLLGDNNSDATLFTYPDASLDAGVQTVIQLGKVKCFKLNPVDPTQITPDIVNPNHFALLCYHTVKAFVDPLPDSYSFKTRAQSERFGHWRAFIGTLESEIYHLENGRMFSGWMNYFNWISGMSGLPLGQVLTQLNVNQPIFGQQFSLDSYPIPIDEVIKF